MKKEKEITVAVVDDDASLCRALRRLLNAWDMRAVTYPSAEAFLEDVHRPTLDCLILDIQLGGMSGFADWLDGTNANDGDSSLLDSRQKVMKEVDPRRNNAERSSFSRAEHQGLVDVKSGYRQDVGGPDGICALVG